jgi:hypothetical protein
MNELKLNLGAPALCRDGGCGRLARVAVDPEAMSVSHLIVESGLLAKRSRVLPITLVESTIGDEIHLSIGASEVYRFPEYREVVQEEPLVDHSLARQPTYWHPDVPYPSSGGPQVLTRREKVRVGVPEEVVVLEKGAAVEGLEGRIGRLEQLLVEPESGIINHVIVRQGLLLTTLRSVPAFMVESITERLGVYLATTGEELEDLPEYVDGEHLSEEAVMSEHERKSNPGPAAREITEEELATRVAVALFNDERTGEAIIEVIDDRGIITLQGQVEDAQTRRAAEEIAAGQPGVISVVNAISVNSQ